MTNSTQVYWDVDGVSLQTYCMNVESLAPKWAVPTHRGEDSVLAAQHGEQHRAKYLASRTIPLEMWVNAFDADGKPTAKGPERQFNENISGLRALVFREFSEQVVLSKRWRDPLTGDVVSASAPAELVSAFDMEMQGPYSAKVSLEFNLANPLFYGAPVVHALTTAGLALDVVGDVATSAITVAYNGSLTNAEMRNETMSPEVMMRLGLSVAVGDKVHADVRNFTAFRESDGANVVGAVTRSGSRSWFRLQPGVNNISLTVSGGSGDATLTYRPAYL